MTEVAYDRAAAGRRVDSEERSSTIRAGIKVNNQYIP
jgi:hypothetical protein